MSATHQESFGRHRMSSMASMTRNVNSASVMIRCSSSIMYPSSSTGRVAIAAHFFDTRLWRSRA